MVFIISSKIFKIDKNDIYQWGNLFKNSKTEKNDTDMLMINSKAGFEGREVLSISCKYKIAGAVVKSTIETDDLKI